MPGTKRFKDGEELTQETLKKYLYYDPGTGKFTTRKFSQRSKGGRSVGYKHHTGYWVVGFHNSYYSLSRLAWFYVYGVWPKGEVDHINQDKDDNRIENLRDVSARDNSRNRPMASNNTSGKMGVTWSKATGKWQVRIGIGGKNISAGFFGDKNEAIRRREELEREHGYHPGHGRAA